MELCSMLRACLDVGGLGENGYMCMYGWVLSLFIWNNHNIVNQLPQHKMFLLLKQIKINK